VKELITAPAPVPNVLLSPRAPVTKNVTNVIINALGKTS
jgi:hypothetical protein